MKPIDYSIIWKSIHGSLEEHEQKKLDKWIHEDTTHKEYYLKMANYFKHGSSFDQEALDKQTLWEKIEKEIIEKPSRKQSNWYWWAAASLFLVVSLVVGLQTFSPKLNEEQSFDNILPGDPTARLVIDGLQSIELNESVKELEGYDLPVENVGTTLQYEETGVRDNKLAYHTLITPKGGEYSVKLSDGTTVWLNADSRLHYPETFIGPERRVELTGEAYFEVTHSEEQAFIVSTSNQEIRVYGTSFNVTAYAGDSFEHTTLEEGLIGVSIEGLESRINPSQQIYFDKIQQESKVIEVDTYQYTTWRNKIFYFEDTSLGQIVKVLSRWYDFEFEFADERKKELIITAGFKRHDSFESIVKSIELTNEVKFEIKNGIMVIE